MTEVTKDRYQEMLGCLPPVYISEIDGQPINGFACSEAYTHTRNAVVLGTYYKDKATGKYYETFCELYTPEGKAVFDTWGHTYGTGYKCKTVDIKR